MTLAVDPFAERGYITKRTFFRQMGHFPDKRYQKRCEKAVNFYRLWRPELGRFNRSRMTKSGSVCRSVASPALWSE